MHGEKHAKSAFSCASFFSKTARFNSSTSCPTTYFPANNMGRQHILLAREHIWKCRYLETPTNLLFLGLVLVVIVVVIIIFIYIIIILSTSSFTAEAVHLVPPVVLVDELQTIHRIPVLHH